MDTCESLSHTKWECKYHVVFIPKCRKKVLYGNLRRHLGEVFHKLAQQKECRIEEGAPAGGPCAHTDCDTAKVRGITGDRVHQGQERDSRRAGVRREETQLRRPAPVGTRVLRLDRWRGRGHDT